MKVAVVLGGVSFERDVSLKTGEAVIEACRINNYEVEAVIIDKNYQKWSTHYKGNTKFDDDISSNQFSVEEEQ